MTNRRRSVSALALALLAPLLVAACSSSASTASGEASSTPDPGRGVGQASPVLGANLAAVACGGERCAVGGSSFTPSASALAASTDAGVRFGILSSPAPADTRIASIGCASAGCMALGQSGTGLELLAWRSGRAWTAAASPPGAGQAEAVACAGVQRCLAVVGDGRQATSATSTDFGRSWTAGGPLPLGTQSIAYLRCSSARNCMATGVNVAGRPLVAVTADGGASWRPSTLPSSVSQVAGGACSTKTRCFVAARSPVGTGSSLLASRDGGASFTVDPAAGLAVPQPVDVSCTASSCVVVGAGSEVGAAAGIDAKGRVRPIVLAYAPSALLQVSCARPTACVAVSAGSTLRLSPPA